MTQRYLREINELKFDLRKFEYENELLTIQENKFNSTFNKTPNKSPNESSYQLPLQDQRKTTSNSIKLIRTYKKENLIKGEKKVGYFLMSKKISISIK